jgi:uncharacterized protein YcgL (UPF0745 family)
MKCNVYRSAKKADTYLYMPVDHKLEDLPEGLNKLLGEIEHVLEVDLATRSKLANEDINQVRESLKLQGYFLQLPKKHHIFE